MNRRIKGKQLAAGSVLRSSMKMAVATFCSRILGLVREQIMAAYFGASGLTDAFLVAYRIPNLLRDLLAEGAFSAAFVPTFTVTRLGMFCPAVKFRLDAVGMLVPNG